MFDFNVEMTLVSSALNTASEFIGSVSNAEDIEDRDFWLDEDTVFYITSPDDDEIMAATLGDLTTNDLGYLGEFIDKDIISTYLGTKDLLVLVVSKDEEDREAVVLVGDRSTGVMLLKKDNFFDEAELTKMVEIADKNKSLTKPEDWSVSQKHYQMITVQGTDTESPQFQNTRRRLLSLMQDIEIHGARKFSGKPLTYRTDI